MKNLAWFSILSVVVCSACSAVSFVNGDTARGFLQLFPVSLSLLILSEVSNAAH